jgi:NAD-dependent deacetylase
MDNTAIIDTVRGWVAASRRIVVLTGAGISTDSGIPDFRGPQGVWTRNPQAEKQSTLQNYLADAQVRQAAWRGRLSHPTWTAQPNAGHRALVALEARGVLHALITQNIDELHQIAGNGADKVIEVHGTIRRVMCWQCRRRWPRCSSVCVPAKPIRIVLSAAAFSRATPSRLARHSCRR